MRLAVIVNPLAGGGRAGRVLPAVRAALTRLRRAHRIAQTRSLEHARAGGGGGRRRPETITGYTVAAANSDGDPIAQLPATITVLPGAMRVIIPSAA